MERLSRVLETVVPTAASSQPQVNTLEPVELLSWSSVKVEKYLRHWGIEDDAIEASLMCMDKAKSSSEFMEKNQLGLFLFGPPGRGKTTLTTAILRYEIYRLLKKESPYRSIQFVFIPDLLIELQSCFTPGSDKNAGDIIYRVSEYDFLVLDGAGEGGKPSEFVIGAMGTLIHHREAVRKSKRTIIASNYDRQGLAERLDARITSRISGMCDEIPFTGSDMRLNR